MSDITTEKYHFSERVQEAFACPFCSGDLAQIRDGLQCLGCQQVYPWTKNGQIDLHLHKAKSETITYELGRELVLQNGFKFQPLMRNPRPEIEYGNLKIPYHLSVELVSHFPKPKADSNLMLDLGCGEAIHQEFMEHVGYEWVGLDYKSPEAPILGDAHALPFKDDQFEFIFSSYVLEHIQFPIVMMKEAARVLRPGGKFVGTVAFVQPFHDFSFYHHSHLGIYNSLQSAGFDIKHIGAIAGLDGLYTLSNMSLFRKMPELLLKLILFPLQMLHRVWWKLGYIITKNELASEHYRVLSLAGTYSFMATKPNTSLNLE